MSIKPLCRQKEWKRNRLEYVTVEFANIGVDLEADLGAFIKNTTIRSSAEAGINCQFGHGTAKARTAPA